MTVKSTTRHNSTTFGISDEKIAAVILAIIHFSGAMLLIFSKGGMYHFTVDLVPITLILTFLVSIKFQKGFSNGLLFFCLFTFGVGLLAEMIGTNLGWLFGNYTYGEVLGIQLWHTPLVIGLNWVLVCYGVGMLVGQFKIHPILQWLAAIVGLLLFDYFMEPVAIKHGFWEWNDGNIPMSNYIGWALISGLVMAAFHLFSFDKTN